MLKTPDEIARIGRRTIREELDALQHMESFITDDFVQSVLLILNSKGRVILTGIGKSANIAAKIVSTMNSTGTPAFFMHAADAIHGDLGMIREEDVIICLSKSGNTPEIEVLLPLLKLNANKIIAIVGNLDSILARHADYVLNTTVTREACPNNLAPTASTAAQLLMGDALAVALLECRGFTREDFARYHPGGALGKKLYTKVRDIFGHNLVPQVDIHDDMRNVIIEISSKRLGAAGVLDSGNLVGIITDGDIRRMIQNGLPIETTLAGDVMSRDPKTVEPDVLASNALDLMRRNNITQLLVVENGTYKGVIHIHDILKEGII